MRRFTVGLMVWMLLMAAAPTTFAFDLAEEVQNASWGLELGGIYHFGRLDMGHIKYDQREVRRDWDTSIGTMLDLAHATDNEFDRSPILDINFGVYWWRFHAGLMYSRIYQANRSISTEAAENPFVSFDATYMVEGAVKEYLFYIGYVQPITSWLEVGIYGALGPASAHAHQRYEESFNGQPYRYDHSADTDFNVQRFWGKVRYNATQYISIDAHVGYRKSQAQDFRGTLLDGANTYHDRIMQEYATTTVKRELIFDFSGIYYGLGVTLKNPF